MTSIVHDWSTRLAHQQDIARSSVLCPTKPRLIGVDEVGRGALAGPVVAAAAWIDEAHFPDQYCHWLKDSKTINARQRRFIYHLLQRYGRFALAAVYPREIDRINILQATLQAMHLAVDKLSIGSESFVLVDGNQLPSWNYPSLSVVKGDSHCPCIAAASICAKVVRDRLMSIYAEHYPHYDWRKNAGYGTLKHRQAIVQYGYSPLHRQSFKLRSTPRSPSG